MSYEREDEEAAEFIEHAKEDCIKEPRISLTTHYLNSLNLGKHSNLIMENANLGVSDFKQSITKKYKRVIQEPDYISEDVANKLETHLQDLKYLSQQQIFSVRYYFNNWRMIADEMKQNGIDGSIKSESNVKNSFKEKIDPHQNDKVVEDNDEIKLKSKESEKSEIEKIEKKKKIRKTLLGKKAKKEDETIYVIPRADILKYIPFCNDIVMPKKN